jgi:hypothetical protein
MNKGPRWPVVLWIAVSLAWGEGTNNKDGKISSTGDRKYLFILGVG